MLLAGCSWDGTLPTPDPTDDPDRAAAELASGLAKRDLTNVEFAGAAGSAVNAEFQPLVSGMAQLKPRVSVAGVDVQGDAATVTLTYSWTFPGVSARVGDTGARRRYAKREAAGAAAGHRASSIRSWTAATGSVSVGWPRRAVNCSATAARRS